MDGAVPAFVPQSQSEYAFGAPQPGEDDEAAQVASRNQQIQAAFDSQRFQSNLAQNLSKVVSSQNQQIAQLRQQQAQQQKKGF